MRSDLDAIRERHLRREIREELRVPTGDWGWVRVHQVSPSLEGYDARARDVRSPLDVGRPGTPEGGF
jgi:hypothetical protein